MAEIDLNELIEKVKRQTTLSEEEIILQLKMYNNDYIKIIKNHFSIEEKKEEKIVSLNQEIYKQLRKQMDDLERNRKIDKFKK